MTNGTLERTGAEPLNLYRVMKADDAGRPICGSGAGMLGARPRDLSPDADGCLSPGRGGITVGPDPARLHLHFRPKRFGGLSTLPLFSISEAKLISELRYAPITVTEGHRTG